MPDDTTTRWTVSVSRDTDIAVRSFLAQRGMKKGNLSKFIENAVKWPCSIKRWPRRAPASLTCPPMR